MGDDTKLVRSTRAATTSSAILDAAEHCFTQTGFSGTSTRQIAARAGVTQPLLLHYFDSKEDLFEKVLERAVRDYDDEQAPQWQLEPGHLDFFVVGMTVLFRWLGRRRSLLRLMLWARLEGRVETSPKALAVWSKVGERFAAAKQAGLLRKDLPIEEAMMVVDALMKGFWDRHDELRQVFDSAETRPADFERRMEETIVIALIRALLVPAVHSEAIKRFRAIRKQTF